MCPSLAEPDLVGISKSNSSSVSHETSHKIIYIHTIDAHLKRLEIVLEDHSLETIGTLSEWEISLKDYNFILSHRGYLVNTSQIHYFEDKKLIMNNGDAIPVSRRNLFAHICISGGL